MKKNFLLVTIVCTLLFPVIFSYAQEQDVIERVLVLREAQERRKTIVAVEAYLTGDILDVTIITTMHLTKPRVYNVTLVGPRLGRISPKERQTLLPTAEDKELSFPTRDMEGGIIGFTKRTKDKKPKGTLTKDLVKFRIPTDKLIPNKGYQLKIKVESMQRPGQFINFKFELKNLAQLTSE